MSDENKDFELADETKDAKTANELAKEINQSRKEDELDLRAMKNQVESNKKKIAEMSKENEKMLEKIKNGRDKIRSHYMIVLGTTIVKILGFSDRDKKSLTDKEYKNMTNAILREIKKMMGEHPDAGMFTYEDLVFALGLTEEEKAADIDTLKKIIWGKVKKLIEENIAKQGQEKENSNS